MKTRYATVGDRDALVEMRTKLWPSSVDEHRQELEAYFAGGQCFIDEIVVCENQSGLLVGFAELRMRNYAEGSENPAVPYLEGWFVEGTWRGRGVGALLVAGAETWAESNGYSELASDAELDNDISIKAHVALGFEEVERSVSFLKRL